MTKTRKIISGDVRVTGRIIADGGIDNPEFDNARKRIETALSELTIQSTSATHALAEEIAAIADDGILTRAEKVTVVERYETILAEMADIDSLAIQYGLATEKANYDAAITALTEYLEGIAPAYNDYTANTLVDRATFQSKFSSVADTKAAITNKAQLDCLTKANAAATAASNAQSTANGKAQTFYGSDDPPASGTGAIGDYYFNTVNRKLWVKTGASTWTIISSGNATWNKSASTVTMADLETITKSSGTTSWTDAVAYASELYGSCTVSFSPGVTTGYNYMVGLCPTPSSNAYAAGYCWYINGTVAYVYILGSSATSVSSVVTTDRFAISYDGASIRFLRNGTVVYVQAYTAGALGCKVWLYQTGAKVSYISWSSGAMGWRPSWSSDITGMPTPASAYLVNQSAMTGKTAGLYMTETYTGYWTGSAFQSYIDSSGNAHFGDTSDYIDWNMTSALLTVAGTIKLVNNAPTTTTAGLYLGVDKLGYYSGSAWTSYMDNTGRFYLSGTGSNSLSWNGATLTINGGGTFTGALSAATGTFAGSLSAATGTFAGSLTAATITASSALFSNDAHIAFMSDASTNVFGDGLVFATYNLKTGSGLASGSAKRSTNLFTGSNYIGIATELRGYTTAWNEYPKTLIQEKVYPSGALAGLYMQAAQSGSSYSSLMLAGLGDLSYIRLNVQTASDGYSEVYLTSRALYPSSLNKVNLGTSSYPWGVVYADKFVTATGTTFSGSTWTTVVSLAEGEVGMVYLNSYMNSTWYSAMYFAQRSVGGNTAVSASIMSTGTNPAQAVIQVSGQNIQIRCGDASPSSGRFTKATFIKFVS